jgi:hypothetical protein
MTAAKVSPEKRDAIIEKFKTDQAAVKAALKPLLSAMLKQHGLKVVKYRDNLEGNIQVIVDPKNWESPNDWKGAVNITWQPLQDAKSYASEGRSINVFPNLDGFRIHPTMKFTDLYIHPETSDASGPRNKKDLKKFVEFIPKFLASCPGSKYQHTGD